LGPVSSLAHALVVLRGADGQRHLAIAEHKETGLLAGQELLNHHLRARRAKGPAEHVVNRVQRLLFGLGHDHALACGQPVGLDHDGGTLGAHMLARGLRLGEMAIAGGRRARRVADCLGKALGGFEPRRRLAGAENRDPRLAQPVGHARGKRHLGADDDEINRLGLAEPRHRAAVENVERGAIGDLRDPGISGCHDQPVAFGVLQHRPGEAVLAPATAQNEDIHRPHLLGLAWPAF